MTQSCPFCNASNRDTAQFCAQCAQPLRQICSQCGADNPSRSRFCNQCGEPLAREANCPQCGQVNPAGSRFCNACGAVLSPTTPQPQPMAPAEPTTAGTGLLPPQTMLVDRYIVLRRVGKGGMGAVYQVADARIPGKTWAVKEMSDAAITNLLEKQQAQSAFRQEAAMLSNLDHFNLPKVTDHFTEGGKQYLVMDFIEGETLAERLEHKYGEPLPVDMVLGWAGQLCDVLEYLHTHSPPVVFRDLKPANVMITPEGTVKLIDFGIARIFKPGKAADTAYFGTAGYCPKEQYGKGQTDARSDVYALGAVLHHLLTGVDPTDQPFHFEDVRQLNSQVPIPVADAVMKALSDDPSGRWQSIREMRAALTEQPILKPEPPPAYELPESQPEAIAAPQPAMVAGVSVDAAALPQPVPAPTSRLTFWRGLGLILLGAALYGTGAWLAREVSWEYDLPPIALFAWVPALFGVLFGPWVGGFVGTLGFLAWAIFTEDFWDATWAIALAHCTPGIVASLAAKDARKWKAVLWAGVAASVVYTLAIPTAIIGAINGWWGDFGGIAIRFLITALPANVVLLPLVARGLVEPLHQRGLYWRDFH